MNRFVCHYALTAILIAAGAASLRAQNVVPDKKALTFFGQAGGAAVSQTVTFTSTTGSPVAFSLFSNTTDANQWVKLSVDGGTPGLAVSGTTPKVVTVFADPSRFTPGVYTSDLTLNDGPGTSSIKITLTASTLGVNPSGVTFGPYVAKSSAVPTAQTVTVTGGVPFSATYSTTTGGNWLLPPNAATGAVTIQVDPAVVKTLDVGTYQGKVTLTPAGTGNNVPVDIQVLLTVVAAPTVTVNPPSIQFNAQINPSGTNNLTSQVLTITVTPASQINYAITPTLDAALQNKVVVTPSLTGSTAANGTAQVTVTLDPTSLTPNTYNGTLFLGSSVLASPIAIPLKAVVSNSPLLNIPTAPLVFNYNLAAANPAPQTVNVTSTGAVLGYSLTTSANTSWLSVSAPSTPPNTAAPFSVSVNPSGLATGQYTGTITVIGTTIGSGSGQIPVVLNITNDPLIVTNFSSMAFPFQLGQTVPAAQTLRISSSNGIPLTFTATPTQTSCVGTNWLLLNGGAAAITGSSDSGNIEVRVNTTGLPEGTCEGTIGVTATVTSTGAAVAAVSIPVKLYVSSKALVVVTPVSLNFSAPAGGGTGGLVQNLTISSTSPTDAISFSVSTSGGAGWLNTVQQSGSTSTNPTVTVQVAPSQLAAGSYSGSVIITSTTANIANSPVTVPVNLIVTAGSLTLSSTSLNFTHVLGGSVPAAKTVAIGSSGSPLTYTVVTNSGTASGWLKVSPDSGSTASAGTLTVTTDGSKLQPGAYTGKITITAPGASNSPATIDVNLTVQAGVLSVPPGTLTFNQLVGGPAPQALAIPVTGNPGPLNFTVAVDGATPWLTAKTATGVTPGSVDVSVSAGSLGVGQYSGNVVITSPGATGSPITVPIVLNVVAPQTLSVNPASLNFTYTTGQAVPVAQTFTVTASGGGALINAQLQGSPAPAWLQVSPASANAPGTFTVTVSPASLAAGSYTANIAISSGSALTPLTVQVNLTVRQIPKPVIASIVNAGSYISSSVAPGENIVIFGTGLGPDTLVGGTVANGAYTTTAGNTRVLFDGVPAPVYYASALQTSVWVPYGVNGRSTTTIVVEYSGVQSTAATYNVAGAAPGIYTQNQQGNGPGAILNQDGVTLNSPAAPAPRGNVVAIYMTGEGETSPKGADGAIIPAVPSALKTPVLPVTATIGGIPANVVYKGSAPGYVSGLMQVNIEIPATAPTGGAVPLVVTVGTATTQPNVTIAVQ